MTSAESAIISFVLKFFKQPSKNVSKKQTEKSLFKMPTTKADPGNHRESQVSHPVPHGPTTDDSPAPIYSLYGAGEHGTTPSEEIRFSRCVNVKGFDTDLPVWTLKDDGNVKKSWQLMDGVLDEGLVRLKPFISHSATATATNPPPPIPSRTFKQYSLRHPQFRTPPSMF